MNALAFPDAAPLDAWFASLRRWLFLLLASFADALERARRLLRGGGRGRTRPLVLAILREMRASVAETEREVARALVFAAFARVFAVGRRGSAHGLSSRAAPSVVERGRFEARLLKPVLRAWRRGGGGGGGAETRLGDRVRRLAATLAAPERAIETIVDRLVALKRAPTWRVTRGAAAMPCAVASPADRAGPDTS